MELNLHELASRLLTDLDAELEKNLHRKEGVVLLYERIRDEIRKSQQEQHPESGNSAAAEEQVNTEAAADTGTTNP